MKNNTRATRSASIARSLVVAIVTPLALLVLAAALLMFQIERLTEASAMVDHTDQVIASLTRVQGAIIDQETALRGYLLAGTNDFLDPYRNAHPHTHLHDLRTRVSDNALQTRRADDLAAMYDRWFQGAQVELRTSPTTVASIESMRERRYKMDEIRALIATMTGEEEQLRHERQIILASSRQTTFGGIIPALLVLGTVIAFVSRKQLLSISTSFSEALQKEELARKASDLQAWSRAQQVKLSEALMGDLSVHDVCARSTVFVAEATEARVGAYYVAEGETLDLCGKFALPASAPTKVARDEGLVGSALRKHELVHVRDVPKGYLSIESATGNHDPEQVVLLPTYSERMPLGVLELGFFGEVSERALDLLPRVGEIIAGTIRASRQRHQLRELLEETQRQAEEMQTQHEELNASNEELLQQTDAVRAAHAELTERKEELEASNASLEAQKLELIRLSDDLQMHADELARTSRYRSDFVANMSHELRTPLNSTLILAKMLAENKRGNLDAEQVKYAETIFSAGNDLLALINDILDISRIEAGKVDVHLEPVSIAATVQSVERMFEPVAKQRGVVFEVISTVGELSFQSDAQRIAQVLKNLLSNAFKFTEAGRVTLRAERTDTEVRFMVSDSGIGIATHHQEAIFEAFRQADGTTNRRFGGTGLGLSISRELARLLGGDVTLESEEGKGSVFTLTLPLTPKLMNSRALSSRPPATSVPPPAPAPVNVARQGSPTRKRTPAPFRFPASAVQDDRDRLDGQLPLLLVVEDDPSFAMVVQDIGRELGYHCLVATTADEALGMLERVMPAGIVLDVKLPDHSGLSVLDRLKRTPATRHIPVHVISASDKARSARALGAVGYDQKPIKRDTLVAALKRMRDMVAGKRRLLLIADDSNERASAGQLLANDDVDVTAVATTAEALATLRARTFDCIVADLSPTSSDLDLLDRLSGDSADMLPPVVVYTNRNLSNDEEMRLRRHANSIIVKGPRSAERLLDEVTLFLHQVASQLPPERQRALAHTQNRETVLEGRNILLAEDDVRNVFAMTSLLEGKGARLITARNGKQALQVIESRNDIDLILMDIMMPEMDGIEAMHEIRKRGGAFAKIPIIAITAKAMPDDQARCIKAGANDYIAKPLDVEMLLSLIRVWLSS